MRFTAGTERSNTCNTKGCMAYAVLWYQHNTPSTLLNVHSSLGIHNSQTHRQHSPACTAQIGTTLVSMHILSLVWGADLPFSLIRLSQDSCFLISQRKQESNFCLILGFLFQASFLQSFAPRGAACWLLHSQHLLSHKQRPFVSPAFPLLLDHFMTQPIATRSRTPPGLHLGWAGGGKRDRGL